MPLPPEQQEALMTKRECPTPGAPDLPDESQNCAAPVTISHYSGSTRACGCPLSQQTRMIESLLQCDE